MNNEVEYYTFQYKIPIYKIKPPQTFCNYYETHKDEIIIELDKENKKLQQERNNYKELYEKENKNWNELKELLKTELRDVYDKEHPLALDSSYIKYTTERKMNLMWVYEKMQEIERL